MTDRLPGGLWDDSFRVSREFSFARVAGQMEMELTEILPRLKDGALQATAVLSRFLESLGSAPATQEAIHSNLSVGDRQFLMRRISARWGFYRLWSSVRCNRCKSLFDIQVDPSELPVKEAGASYPLGEVETTVGKLKVRAPTGADQVAAWAAKKRRETLAKRLVLNCKEELLQKLTGEDIKGIEEKVQQFSPEVTLFVQTRCVECSQENEVFMDPYNCIPKLAGQSVLKEVHTISRAYHWSEKDILSLPRKRRHAYLALIDEEQGVSS